MPDIERVCEELHGEFEHLAEGSPVFDRIVQLFQQHQLFAFHHIDAFFIGGNDAGSGGFHNAIQQVLDFLLGVTHGLLNSLTVRGGVLALDAPCTPEHILHQIKQPARGFHFRKKRFKLPLYIGTTDGLALALAAFAETHVIRVRLAHFALRPACSDGMTAISAQHKSTQGEVFIDIRPHGDLWLAVQAFLNFLEGFKGNQPRVFALA